METAQTAQGQADKAKSAAQSEAASLGKQLAEWKQRAESAEGELAAIRRREAEEREAQERAEREAQEALQRSNASTLPWQRIGIELVKVPAGRFYYGENNQSMRLDEF